MKQTLIISAMIFLSMATLSSYGQQDPNYTFYRYSMNLYNPAFAGSGDTANLVLGLRSQWAGVEGAPESQSAIFGMPVGRKVGLGVSILNDQTFIETQTWVAIDFSYFVQLDEKNRLYFGLKGSANSYDANTAGLVTYGIGSDGTLMDYESRFTPNIGAGVYLKNDKYFLSLSAPKLLSPERLQEQNGNAFLGVDRIHAYLSGGYDFRLGEELTLQSMGMFRYVDSSPLSFEMTGILDFGSRINLGASYRVNESISGLFMFRIAEGFQLGYAYEASRSSDLRNADNGSHELFMRFNL